MRLIFIPGFGETPRIFNRIAPSLPGEKLFIDNQALLGGKPMPDITAIRYAQLLVDNQHISREDVVIGHSMGGWVAHAIKHLTGCSVVQIASWTDPGKVVLPIKNPEVIYWLVRNGLYLNRVNKQLFSWLNYRNKPSAQIFNEVFEQLIDSPHNYVINQLRVILNPPELAITTQPEVRIHSENDSIIRFPSHTAVRVPGDHFNLITHPENVIAPIQAFLKTIRSVGQEAPH